MQRDHSRCAPARQAAAGGSGTAARAGDPAVGEGLLTGLGQRHEVEAAEAERMGLSVDDEPLDPTACAGRLDVQVQFVAVTVPARLADGAAEGGRESFSGQ